MPNNQSGWWWACAWVGELILACRQVRECVRVIEWTVGVYASRSKPDKGCVSDSLAHSGSLSGCRSKPDEGSVSDSLAHSGSLSGCIARCMTWTHTSVSPANTTNACNSFAHSAKTSSAAHTATFTARGSRVHLHIRAHKCVVSKGVSRASRGVKVTGRAATSTCACCVRMSGVLSHSRAV